ncbi:MAG: hypothetical protein AAB386_04390 [Patescibacteria group bacterium]
MNVQQRIFADVYNEYERGQSSQGLLDPFDHKHEHDDEYDGVPPVSEPPPITLRDVMKRQDLLD